MDDYIVYGGELYHYGRKGMKWYQNIFTAGKERKLARQRRKNLEKARDAKKKKEEEKLSIEQRKKDILASRSAKALYDNANLFTTQELQDAHFRLSLEKRINELEPEKASVGEKFVKKANRVADVLNSGSKAYNRIASLYNAFNGSDKKLPLINLSDKSDNKGDDKGDDKSKGKPKDKSKGKPKDNAETKTESKAETKEESSKSEKGSGNNSQNTKTKSSTKKEGPMEGTVFGEGTSKNSNPFSKKQEGPIYDADFTVVSENVSSGSNYVNVPSIQSTKVSGLLNSGNVSVGQRYIAGLLPSPDDD